MARFARRQARLFHRESQLLGSDWRFVFYEVVFSMPYSENVLYIFIHSFILTISPHSASALQVRYKVVKEKELD